MAKLASLILVIVIATIMVFPFGFEANAQDQCQADCADVLKDEINCCIEQMSYSCFGCEVGQACEYFVTIGQCVSVAKDFHSDCNVDCKDSQF